MANSPDGCQDNFLERGDREGAVYWIAKWIWDTLDDNNVNFEMGTINSKRELWPKNPKKTWKTVLKMKSVYIGMMIFFFGVKFEHVLKMAVKMNFLGKNYAKNTLKMKSVDTRTMAFF